MNNVLRWYKPWFYKHVEGFLKKSGRNVEYIPSRDYYHRHQRCLFWELSVAFPYGNNRIFRYLFGWVLMVNPQLVKLFMPMTVQDLFLKQRHHIIQDFGFPIHKMKKALEFTHQNAQVRVKAFDFDTEHSILKQFMPPQVYPIWLCPVIMFPTPAMTHSTTSQPEMYVDIGIYGECQSEKTCDSTVKETIRDFEKFALENQG